MDLRRRRFGQLAVASAMPLGACSGSAASAYEAAVRDVWRHGPLAAGNAPGVLHELVRYAALAPSSHNTQCWRFAVAPGAITIRPDFSRRCPAVDPDDHHLYVSLGCAAENLVQAALAHGLRPQARFDAGSGGVRIDLEPAPAVASALFKAIPERQTTRGDYDGRPLAGEELRLLETAASAEGVQAMLLTARPAVETVLEWVVKGNGAQMQDAAFVEELKAWIRFSAADAVRTGDGLYAASSGNPSVPAWLGRRMFPLFFTEQAENDKYARHLRSSAGVAVFVGPGNDPAGWVAVGRAFERFALQATTMGVRTAHLNQPIEVAGLRPAFARELGIGDRRPDLVVRFGRGPTLPASLRRPVQAVIEAAATSPR